MPAEKDREAEIHARLAELLRPGETCSARALEDGTVEVRLDRSHPTLAAEHPELAVALRRANRAVSGAGCFLAIGALVVGVSLAFAAERGWLPLGLAGRVGFIETAFILLATGWLAFAAERIRRRIAYASNRESLLEAIRRSGLTSDQVLARIAGDERLDEVFEFIASDGGVDDHGGPR